MAINEKKIEKGKRPLLWSKGRSGERERGGGGRPGNKAREGGSERAVHLHFLSTQAKEKGEEKEILAKVFSSLFSPPPPGSTPPHPLVLPPPPSARGGSVSGLSRGLPPSLPIHGDPLSRGRRRKKYRVVGRYKVRREVDIFSALEKRTFT